MKSNSQKRILSIDGGGIRGIVSLVILRRVEECLRRKAGDPNLVLSDYFDYVAGASAGSVIATCVALGMPVDRIIDIFENSLDQLFSPNPNWFLRFFTNKYSRTTIVKALQEIFGKDTTLGPRDRKEDNRLKCLLLLIMLNASTASPWPISSNPLAKYNQGPYSNLNIPLWQLVRASTAAPYFYPPEIMNVGGEKYEFYDGGLTGLNNPSMKVFQMATHPAYNLNWQTGSENLLLVSVGSGNFPKKLGEMVKFHRNFIENISLTLESVIFNSVIENDLSCRSIGKIIFAENIDTEVGNMSFDFGVRSYDKQFSYIRYNPNPNQLSEYFHENNDILTYLTKGPIQLDDVKALKPLKHFAETYAINIIKESHFDQF